MPFPRTERLAGTSFYFVTEDIRYLRPPSMAANAARRALADDSRLTPDEYGVLFQMLLEIDGLVRGGVDRWVGFEATAIAREKLRAVRDLTDRGHLIRHILEKPAGGSIVVYILSPALVP